MPSSPRFDPALTLSSFRVDGGEVAIQDVDPTLFHEIRSAAPFALLDQVNKYEVDTDVWSTARTTLGGSVAHFPTSSGIKLSVDGSPGVIAGIRTNKFFRYQAGRMQTIRVTGFSPTDIPANVQVRIGYFDENDGLFFKIDEVGIAVVRRTSAGGASVDHEIYSEEWSVDRMNSAGPSGNLIAPTFGNIYEIRFQWLGVGFVHYYVNGQLVHELPNPGKFRAAYMRTAQLPVSVEVECVDATDPFEYVHICSSVSSDGGEEPPVEIFCPFNTADRTVTTTEIPLLAIRPKLLYNGIVNRMTILPAQVRVSTEGARAGWRLVYIPNATAGVITGGSWTSVNARSGCEQNIGATSFSGAGIQTLDRGFLPNSNDKDVIDLAKVFGRLKKSLHLDATGTLQPIVAVLGVNEAAGNTAMRASILLNEIR